MVTRDKALAGAASLGYKTGVKQRASLLLSIFFTLVLASQGFGAVTPPLSVYDLTMSTVQHAFHDRTMRGLPWSELVTSGRQELGKAPSEESLNRTINAVLGQLAPGAPRFLDHREQAYWVLLGASSGRMDGARLRQVGAWFERKGKRWFVAQVFGGSPADRAGLLRGDEIVNVDGGELKPVMTFRDARPGTKLKIQYRRFPAEALRETLVDTSIESFEETMQRGMRRAYRLFEVNKKKIAYVTLPSASHKELRDEFQALVVRAAKDADAMVLDLRGDYGGLDGTPYESLMAPPNSPLPPVFNKPIAVLVDKSTSSGKERLAGLIQHQGRGKLVGEPTAGFALAGQVKEIDARRSLVYLGVADSGKAVDASLVPDVKAEGSLMYVAGNDEALKAALALLAGPSVP